MAEVLGTALMRLRVAISMKLRLAILLVFARLLVLDAPATLGHRCLPPNLPFRVRPRIINASRDYCLKLYARPCLSLCPFLAVAEFLAGLGFNLVAEKAGNSEKKRVLHYNFARIAMETFA